MYKTYIVILLALLNLSVFSQYDNSYRLYLGTASGLNYPVIEGINGSKFSVPLTIELGLSKKSLDDNDWFLEFNYSSGNSKEQTNYYVSYDSTYTEKYFQHEIKNKVYSLHIGTRIYLKNGPFIFFSLGISSKQYSGRISDYENITTGEKRQYTSPGYGDNKGTFNIGVGKEFIISEKIFILPVFKALGVFYIFIPYFYSSSIQIMAGYKF